MSNLNTFKNVNEPSNLWDDLTEIQQQQVISLSNLGYLLQNIYKSDFGIVVSLLSAKKKAFISATGMVKFESKHNKHSSQYDALRGCYV